MEHGHHFQVASLAAMQSVGKWRLTSLQAERSPAFYALTRGQGRVVVAGRTRGLNAPCYLYIPAGTALRFEFSGSISGTKLKIDPALVASLPTEPILLRGIGAQDQRTIAHHLAQIEEERGSNRPAARRAIAAHANLLAVALERAHSAAGALPWCETKGQKLTARFMALIETDIADGTLNGPSVAEYAERLGITSTHLTRVCQAELGQGASSYLQDRLLSEAQRRLKETGLPVQSIARDLGYRSAAYFTRAYGARIGQTPSATRIAEVRKTTHPH
ncbi:MAG: AraC family transcriptional regulator [Pseudomonadota bacterium]